MRGASKWIAGLTVGVVVGVAVSWAYQRHLGRLDANVELDLVAHFDNKSDEFMHAWQAMPRGGARPLNRKERVLQMLLADLASTNGSSVYNLGVYRTYDYLMRQHLGRDQRVRLLEIGPGINLGSGLGFCMHGAEKYYGLDLYMDPDLLAVPQYESMVKLLQLVSPQSIKVPPDACMKIVDGKAMFDTARVEYLYPRQSFDIPLPDRSLEYVFSAATLEHVIDPQKTVEAIARVLVRGGVTAHQIDLRDHRNFSEPLEFLKVDAATWNRQLATGNAPGYTNRWRASDFKSALEHAGLELISMEATHRTPVDDKIRLSLHPDFQRHSNEDLSIVAVLVVARKP